MVVLDDDDRKFVARLPIDVAKVSYNLITFPGHLLLTVKPKDSWALDAYKLDLKKLIWTTFQVPMAYFYSVSYAACVII